MREAQKTRKTNETDIKVLIRLDGTGKGEIKTGIEFFDHMLTALRAHAGLDLSVIAEGDLGVDCHHTVEDTGITLGLALAEALGDKSGIARYGSFLLPMDEALASCALDISGRAFFLFDCAFAHAMMGGMETAMVGEFFRAVAMNAGLTLHLSVPYGSNDHHKTEALFKAFAHSLSIAAKETGTRVLSTKGVL